MFTSMEWKKAHIQYVPLTLKTGTFIRRARLHMKAHLSLQPLRDTDTVSEILQKGICECDSASLCMNVCVYLCKISIWALIR